DCALLGGETAEMPDVYSGTTFDLAGFLVGIAEREELIDPSQIREGDAILALPSSGLHTNGYSLARRVVPTQALPLPVTPGGPTWRTFSACPGLLGSCCGANVGAALEVLGGAIFHVGKVTSGGGVTIRE